MRTSASSPAGQPIATRTRLAALRNPGPGGSRSAAEHSTGDAAAEYANGGSLLGSLRRTLTDLVGSPAFGPNGTHPGHVRPRTMPRTAQAESPTEIAEADEIMEAEPSVEAPGRESEGDLMAKMRVLMRETEQSITKALDDRLAPLVSRITSIEQEHAQLKSSVSSVEGRMGAMEKKVHDHGDSLAAVQRGIGAEKKARQGTDKAVTDLSARLEADLDLMNNQMQKMQTGLEQAETERARLEKLVADLSTTMAEVRVGEPRPGVVGREGAGSSAPGGQSGLLQHKLQEEGLAYGRSLKLIGFLGAEQKLSGLALCQAAAKVLSARLGGLAVTVERAIWFKVREGAAPKLLVVLSTMAMAHAVRGLRGAYGGASSKLAAGERILDEYGPVEMAVREVLFKERGQVQGSWVGRSALMSREASGMTKVHPLPPAAFLAGFAVMHEGKRARVQPAQRAQADKPEDMAE